MKVKCENVIASTDKKVLTPFTKGKEYDCEPLVIGGKVIPNEFVISGAEREHKHGSGWIALTRWPNGLAILGIATFKVVDNE